MRLGRRSLSGGVCRSGFRHWMLGRLGCWHWGGCLGGGGVRGVGLLDLKI